MGYVLYLQGTIICKIRWLFAISYNKKGGALNKGRIAGAALSLLSILINVGIFGVQIYKKLKNWFEHTINIYNINIL